MNCLYFTKYTGSKETKDEKKQDRTDVFGFFRRPLTIFTDYNVFAVCIDFLRKKKTDFIGSS